MKPLTVAFAAFCLHPAILAAADRPNVIVIFTDDQGYADLGAAGHVKDVKTPHLDALAADGVTCTAGYITAPQCSPSRAGIITGRYQQRFDFDTIPNGPLPLAQVTIAERLQELGYRTGMVGKWHLEPNHTCVAWAKDACPERIQRGRVILSHQITERFYPRHQGFDEFYKGDLNNYWINYGLDGRDRRPAGQAIRKSGFRLDIQTDAALAFIDRNHTQPFFLYLCYYAPHVPLEATEKYLARFPGDMPERRRTALAMISAMDDGVGRIRDRLLNYGIDQNTIVFYLSDNGAPLGAHTPIGPMADVLPVGKAGPAWDGSRNDPLTGEKGMLMEGGIRVPYLVSWPAKLPKGTVYDQPVSSLDVAATCMIAAGQPIPPELDGIDIVPTLTGKRKEQRTLYWRFWNQAAIRRGAWKYFTMGDGREYLVDLSTDPEEKHNLRMHFPETARSLRAELSQWTARLQPVGMPAKPPNGQELRWYRNFPVDPDNSKSR